MCHALLCAAQRAALPSYHVGSEDWMEVVCDVTFFRLPSHLSCPLEDFFKRDFWSKELEIGSQTWPFPSQTASYTAKA